MRVSGFEGIAQQSTQHGPASAARVVPVKRFEDSGTPAAVAHFGLAMAKRGEEDTMTARYLLLLIIVLYVVFELFVPAMQNIFGYGFGTLIALFVLWYVFVANRGTRVV